MTAQLHHLPGPRFTSDAPAHRRRSASLELTSEQRAWMGDHGFGPGAPARDFNDPAVRAQLVQALRDCGVLPPAPEASAPPRLRRVG